MQSLEEALVKEAQRGDVAAFEAVIGRHQSMVYNLACRVMGNPSDAADAAQEALVKVYLKLPHFRGEAAFSTWLYRLVLNTCRDEMRRRRTERSYAGALTPGDEEDRPLVRAPGGLDQPDVAAERQELRRTVQQAISRLREEFRILIVLRDLQGWSYAEIVEVTGLTLATVKSRLHRARLALRAILCECAGGAAALAV